ncbi:MAG: hypothetical protein CMF51_03375 [Legionellales bacterium]|nr:hypothetical protein [Legionellales bacterium]
MPQETVSNSEMVQALAVSGNVAMARPYTGVDRDTASVVTASVVNESENPVLDVGRASGQLPERMNGR